ncbi:hypothetical protein CQJ94_08600 [Glycomyces fuscus]|nr:hypothetical protein CQJ94_08600 [Glycomyces fuscus]
MISHARSTPLHHEAVTPEQYQQGALDAGLPEEVAETVTDLFSNIHDSNGAHLSDGVQRALSRQPRSVQDFVDAAIADGSFTA